MAVTSLILGMMSGTSLDGVDGVVTGFPAAGAPRFVRRWSRRYPPALRSRLLAAAEGESTSWECGQLHHDLGRFYAAAARRESRPGEVLTAVGLHGQTVFHRPHRSHPATWQLGEPAYLAEALRVPVVANFRVADLAAGGQGAPLATLFHVRVFAERGRHVCVNNLGGISNVTSIDWRRGAEPRVVSFDTGPANILLDAAMARLSDGRQWMDRGGRLAVRGTGDEGLLRGWLRHPFLRRVPPKSTGRESFGAALLDRFWKEMDEAGLGAADRLATLAEFTARSVAFNYRAHLPAPPDRVVLCGGGARNPDLSARIGRALGFEAEPFRHERRLVTCAEFGWPPDAVEGGAFAVLARERLEGRPGNLPMTTGARRAVWCGQVVFAG